MGMVSSPAKEYLGSLYVQQRKGRDFGCSTMTSTHLLQPIVVAGQFLMPSLSLAHAQLHCKHQ